MFGASLKAFKTKHLGKKLNFSQTSTFSSKFGEKVKIPHLTEALQASKCYGVTSDTRLSFLPGCFAFKAFKEVPNILESQLEYISDH